MIYDLWFSSQTSSFLHWMPSSMRNREPMFVLLRPGCSIAIHIQQGCVQRTPTNVVDENLQLRSHLRKGCENMARTFDKVSGLKVCVCLDLDSAMCIYCFKVGHHLVHNSRAHPPFSDNLPDIVHELGTLKRGDWGYWIWLEDRIIQIPKILWNIHWKYIPMWVIYCWFLKNWGSQKKHPTTDHHRFH